MQVARSNPILNQTLAGLRKMVSGHGLPAGFGAAAVHTVCGNVFLRASQLFASLYLARVLDQKSFGLVVLVQSTLLMFVTLGAVGGGPTATRLVALRLADGGAVLGSAIAVSLGIAAAGGLLVGGSALFAGPQLSAMFFSDPAVGSLVVIGGVYIALASVQAAQLGILQGFKAFAQVRNIQIVTAAMTIVAYLVAVRRYGAEGAMWAFVASMFVACALGTRAVLAVWRASGALLRIKALPAELPVLWIFSLPIMLSGLMTAPVNWAMNVLLAKGPEGFTAVALFNAANNLRLFVLFLPLLFVQAIFPFAVSSMSEERNSREYQTIQRLTFDYIAIPLHVAALALALFAEPIMRVYGLKYVAGADILALLLISVAVQGFGIGSSIALQCSNRLWFGLILNFVWAAALLVTGYWLRTPYGARAVALGMVFGYAILNLAQLTLVRDLLPAGTLSRAAGGILINAGIAVGFVWIPSGVAKSWILGLGALVVLPLLLRPRAADSAQAPSVRSAVESALKSLNARVRWSA